MESIGTYYLVRTKHRQGSLTSESGSMGIRELITAHPFRMQSLACIIAHVSPTMTSQALRFFGSPKGPVAKDSCRIMDPVIIIACLYIVLCMFVAGRKASRHAAAFIVMSLVCRQECLQPGLGCVTRWFLGCEDPPTLFLTD